jgi:hypothetical protein
VKAENPSACATVNSKLCRSATALLLLASSYVNKVSSNPIIQSKTRHIRNNGNARRRDNGYCNTWEKKVEVYRSLPLYKIMIFCECFNYEAFSMVYVQIGIIAGLI